MALPIAALAYHDSYFTPSLFNVPGQPLPNHVSYDSNSIGATSPEPGVPAPPGQTEADTCFDNDTPNVQYSYERTVWYQFSPHRTGDVTIQVTRLSPATFLPIPVIFRFDSAAGYLDYANAECEQIGVNSVARPRTVRVQEGSTWKVQVGGDLRGTTREGYFRIELFFDPDTDRDGVLDSRDQCAHPGRVDLGGCTPDTDGDGLRDFDDVCDLDPIPRGVTDGPPRNGCPDLRIVSAQPKFGYGEVFLKRAQNGRYRPVGVKGVNVAMKGLSRGTRISLSCTQRACGGVSRVSKGSRELALLRKPKLRLRNGTKLILRATRPGWVGRYFELAVTKRKLVSTFKRERCTRPGRSKPVVCEDITLIR